MLTNKYAGGAQPDGSRAKTKFAHFLTAEKALTPENIAASERFAAWCAGHGLAPAPVALAWVLRNPQVSSAITGATRPAQLDENLKSLDVKLSAAEWKQVEGAIAGKRAIAVKNRSRARPSRRARPA